MFLRSNGLDFDTEVGTLYSAMVQVNLLPRSSRHSSLFLLLCWSFVHQPKATKTYNFFIYFQCR